jgi:hypothetical protein
MPHIKGKSETQLVDVLFLDFHVALVEYLWSFVVVLLLQLQNFVVQLKSVQPLHFE